MNIKMLLPNFTMDKFLKHIRASQQVKKEEILRIVNVLSVTPSEILEQFDWFFRYEEDRPDIGFIGGMYDSLVDMVAEIKPKKVDIKVDKREIPFDICFYIETLDMFYDLSKRYGSQNFYTTEFHL